ncbi:hypothetical protein [Chitinophaga sp. MM2321]|uniref:hypothetical protein n=1 Tax=Chitinophaga sp. MM2321 TaxID=3137178 RepID=UPI0032D583D8
MKKTTLKTVLTAIFFSLSIVVVNTQYIQDQFAIFQPATFRISGTGTLKNIITTAGQGEHFTLRTTSNRWNIYLSGVDVGNNTESDLTFIGITPISSSSSKRGHRSGRNK